MKGSLILEKINDPALRRVWHGRLEKLYAALENLNKVRQAQNKDPSKLQYLEAVLRFADARDDERTFFWDTFIEERSDKE